MDRLIGGIVASIDERGKERPHTCIRQQRAAAKVAQVVPARSLCRPSGGDQGIGAKSRVMGATLRFCLFCRLLVLCTPATCPLANSVDGLTAASYRISHADIGVVSNGSIELNDFSFRVPEVTQRRLTYNDW